jgi:hypothetical protein
MEKLLVEELALLTKRVARPNWMATAEDEDLLRVAARVSGLQAPERLLAEPVLVFIVGARDKLQRRARQKRSRSSLR